MSEVKVNKISPRTACGTVTLGDSGDTFTIPSGATINNQGTAVNFGATGSASWVTTVKTTDFTAVAGEGYFVNTTGGEIDVTLPAGTAGAVVAVADYANNFATANCILKQNGSDKIEGSTDDLVINQEGVSITLVFVDSTKGWVTTDTGNSTNVFVSPSITATGGTITTVNCGACKVHTFTAPGTFCVSAIAGNAANNEISYMIVGGGGGAGSNQNPGGPGGSGGGGAGGFREVKSPVTPYTASPLDGYGTPGNRVTVTATAFPIVVGSGGAGGPSFNNGTIGVNSTAFSKTSAGGGSGGKSGPGGSPPGNLGSPGGAGGSGGAGGGSPGTSGSGGAGNTPPVSPSQGFAGGSGATGGYGGGSGGGATVVGYNAVSSPAGNPDAPTKSTGATTSINGSPTAFAGGGGGGGWCGGTAPGNVGGAGGGGQGSFGPFPAGGSTATAGTANTGGGGGGVFNSSGVTGKNGGSGIVIIRYKIQ